jgi:hypothetical protein
MPEREFEYQPPPISRHQLEYGENWSEREQYMFDNLTQQVDTVLKFKKSIDSITFEQSEAEVKQSLQEAVEQSWDDLYEAAQTSDQDEGDKVSKSQRQYNIDKRLWSMIKDTHEMLVHKYMDIQSLPALDKDELAKIMEERTFIPKDVFSRAEIIWAPFSVTFICTEEDYTVIARRFGHDPVSTRAIHASSSEFNFVKARENKAQQDASVRHENMHNLLDATGEEIRESNPKSDIRELTSWIKQDHDELGEEAGVERARMYFTSDRTRHLIDGIHNELLGHLENIETNQSWVVDHVDTRMRVNIDSDPDVQDFATVGVYVNDTLMTIRGYKNTAPPAIAAEFERLENIFTERVQRVVTELRSAIYTASRLGPDAFDEVHILAAVLKPTQYHHMKKYLVHKYGKDEVELASSDLSKEA